MLFCLTKQGEVYRVKEQTEHTIWGVHEKHWINSKGKITDKATETILSMKRIVVIHENLFVVRGGYTDKEDQDALVRLSQLQKIADDFEATRTVTYSNEYIVQRVFPLIQEKLHCDE